MPDSFSTYEECVAEDARRRAAHEEEVKTRIGDQSYYDNDIYSIALFAAGHIVKFAQFDSKQIPDGYIHVFLDSLGYLAKVPECMPYGWPELGCPYQKFFVDKPTDQHHLGEYVGTMNDFLAYVLLDDDPEEIPGDYATQVNQSLRELLDRYAGEIPSSGALPWICVKIDED